MKSLDRRMFLHGAGTLAGALATTRIPGAWAAAASPDSPFTLGVASGDPLSHGVVLWTRLAPEPLAPDGGMPARTIPVEWEVAADEGFTQVVHRGVATAVPEHAHTVHVDATGLEPARWYWYRFRADQEISPVGRTRTAPAGDMMPDRFRFAFASCSQYEHGFFTAYRHIAEEDLDLAVHLGDYLYEYPAGSMSRRAATSGTTSAPRSPRSRTTASGTPSTRRTRTSKRRTLRSRGS